MPAEALILVGGCFVAAFASGMAGFAFGLVAAGILFHWLPPQETAPVIVIGSLLVQLGTIRAALPGMRWSALRPYLVGGVLGTPVGIAVLRLTDARLIVAGIGLLLIGYAGYMLSRLALRLAPRHLTAGPRTDAAVGFASGILGGIGGFSGALPAMWVDLQGLRKEEARGLLQPFILAMQGLAAIGLVAGGFLGAESLRMLLMALPALVAGAWLGVRAYRVIPAQGFRVVLLGLLLLSGLSLVI